MTQKRKRYDMQFKIAAARVVLGGEMRAVDLARELGVGGNLKMNIRDCGGNPGLFRVRRLALNPSYTASGSCSPSRFSA